MIERKEEPEEKKYSGGIKSPGIWRGYYILIYKTT